MYNDCRLVGCASKQPNRKGKHTMKRFISILLTVVLVLGLCACNSGGAGETTETTVGAPDTFQAGYGNTNITPLLSQGPQTLGGHAASYAEAQTDTYEKIIDDLPCTCVALTDTTGKTVLVYSLETLKVYSSIMDLLPTVAEGTGIPAENILVSSTHNHHAPNTHPSYVNADYLKYIGDQMIAAGKLALEDRKGAKMYATSTNLEGYNSCRHYIMSDGRKATTTELSQGGTPVDHVVEADNQLQLVKFVREGGQDIVMLNWQTHPYTSTSYMNIVSCTEQMRKVFEENNQLMIHFNGASGNITYSSKVPGVAKFASTEYNEAFKALAGEAIDLDSTYQEVQLGNLNLLSNTIQANSTKINIYGLAFGDTAILFMPYEMFTENGMYVKSSSPFKTTILATNAMGDYGYIPSIGTFEYGGYEVESCRVGQGAAEILQLGYAELLAQLNQQKGA